MSLLLSRLRGDVPVLGPIGVAITTLTTVASQVLAADPVRHGLLFHNPGATTKRVLPVGPSLVGGAGGIEILPQSDFVLLEQGDDELFNVNCAWQAVTDNNSDGALTVWNFTDNNQSVSAPEMVTSLYVSVPITSPTPTVASVGVTSQSVLAANPNRRGILFQNPSANLIAVAPANLAAALGAGSRVILPGGELRFLAKGRVRVNCGFNAIAASGSTPLTILEFI